MSKGISIDEFTRELKEAAGGKDLITPEEFLEYSQKILSVHKEGFEKAEIARKKKVETERKNALFLRLDPEYAELNYVQRAVRLKEMLFSPWNKPSQCIEYWIQKIAKDTKSLKEVYEYLDRPNVAVEVCTICMFLEDIPEFQKKYLAEGKTGL